MFQGGYVSCVHRTVDPLAQFPIPNAKGNLNGRGFLLDGGQVRGSTWNGNNRKLPKVYFHCRKPLRMDRDITRKQLPLLYFIWRFKRDVQMRRAINIVACKSSTDG